MGAWLESLIPWGTEVIVWVQSLSNRWLDAIFLGFTSLGYGEFYLFLLPLIYWCLHRGIAVRLAYVSLLSACLNDAIKYIFRIPRPDDPRIRIPWPETSPSFPSGHAQNAVVNWGYIAYAFRKPLLWVLAIIAILGIGLSRIVLGVHFPQDVLAGWAIGLVVLGLYIWAEPSASRWIGRQRTAIQLILAVVGPTILIFLHPVDTQGLYPGETAITSMSALAGLGVGVILERGHVRFQVDGEWWRRVLRFLLGIVIVGALYAGPQLLIPAGLSHTVEAILRFARYALVGWAVAFLAPWLFVRLHLAGRESH